jgi:hypothetical protein
VISVVLASPVFLVLKFHAGRSWYLAEDAGYQLFFDLLQIPRLTESSTILQWTRLPASLAWTIPTAIGGVLVSAGIVARGLHIRPINPLVTDFHVPRVIYILCASSSTLFCAVFWRPLGASKSAAAAMALPWVFLGAWSAVSRFWPHWYRWVLRIREWPLIRLLMVDAIVAHALLPLVILGLTAILVPCLAPRGLLILTPFYLMLAARGLFALTSSRAARATILVFLLGTSAISVYDFALRSTSPRDFHGLAEGMNPLLKPNDLVFVRNAWWSQALHYYLPPDRTRTAPFTDLNNAINEGSDTLPRRFWIVVFDTDESLEGKLTTYRHKTSGHLPQNRVSALAAEAILFEDASSDE